MAGQNLAGRRDIERPASPSAHAGFGVACEIVRQGDIDHDAAVVALAQSLDTTSRVFDLLSGRHQLGAVHNGPAVVLNVGNLDPRGAKRDRLVNHRGDAVDIGTMDDSVDREQNAEPHRSPQPGLPRRRQCPESRSGRGRGRLPPVPLAFSW